MFKKIKNFIRECYFIIQLPYLLLTGKLLGGTAGFESDDIQSPVLSTELLTELGISDTQVLTLMGNTELISILIDWASSKFNIHLYTFDNEVNCSATFDTHSFIANSELFAVIQACEYIILSHKEI